MNSTLNETFLCPSNRWSYWGSIPTTQIRHIGFFCRWFHLTPFKTKKQLEHLNSFRLSASHSELTLQLHLQVLQYEI